MADSSLRAKRSNPETLLVAQSNVSRRAGLLRRFENKVMNYVGNVTYAVIRGRALMSSMREKVIYVKNVIYASNVI